MSFFYISHASEDKRGPVRVLTEAFIELGEAVWVDRPGDEEDGMGLTQGLIDKSKVEWIKSGRAWPAEIKEALRQSTAVIGCISPATVAAFARGPLHDEMTYALIADKLLLCSFDRAARSETLVGNRTGLLAIGDLQCPIIDPIALKEELALLQNGSTISQSTTPNVGVVQRLVASALPWRHEPRPLRRSDAEEIIAKLGAYPIGPALEAGRVPTAIVQALAQECTRRDWQESALHQANEMLRRVLGRHTEQQMLLDLSRLPQPGGAPLAFWQSALAQAVQKSRRTAAALLLAPAVQWAVEKAGTSEATGKFLVSLRQ